MQTCVLNVHVSFQPFEGEMKKYQTIRNKPSTHSSMDNSSNIGSSFQLRESQSYVKSRGEQNDLFENVLQHHSQYRRSHSSRSLPQFKYEAISPELYYDDPYPGKSPSAGNVFFTFI